MISRMLYAAVILGFAAAHAVALQKMHAAAAADPVPSAAIAANRD
jgi:hypothetical protein